MTREESNEKKWYVMRVYKNEKKAEATLANESSLKFFIPKKRAIRTYHGKKTIVMQPAIPSLVFVYAGFQQLLDFKHFTFGDLQFVTRMIDESTQYLTVPEKEMRDFMSVCAQMESEPTYFRPDEINIAKGTKVRVHGGAFDNVEGIFVKVKGKRSRQLVVLLTGVMAVATTVSPEFLEIIE